MRVAEFGSTSEPEMSVFHQLSVGKGIWPFKLAPIPKLGRSPEGGDGLFFFLYVLRNQKRLWFGIFPLKDQYSAKASLRHQDAST